MALNCPLCCNETFSTLSDLRSHVLDVLDNLTCRMCQEKFKKLTELAEHLENDCTETLIVTSDLGGFEEGLEDVEGDSPEASILAKALLGSSQPDDENEDGDPQYYCQMCDLNFDDVDTHLNSCHEGQEFVLEEEDTEPSETLLPEETVIVINTDSPEKEPPPSPPSTPKPNPVPQQQEFKDKDGRLYTRKFVKIDKFWLQEDAVKQDSKPLVQQYIISNNGVKKVEEVASDRTEIIEIKMCTNCNVYFPASESYTCNNCGAAESKGGNFKCEVCSTTFPSFKSLRLHKRMHEPVKVREIEPPVNYDDDKETVRHMFICKVCNKTYDKKYELVHMNSHISNNGFNCNVCNRKFFTKTNLDMHMKAHSNNKKFTCSYCKKPFVTYDALNEHLLNQCQKRPYACQFCGRRFARPHEKVKHERIHTGEKPHVCEICGKAFRVSYCLTLHLRTHSGTRPYQCKHCGKRFKSHSVYNHHMLTHSDVRAYKCPFCPKAFKTSVQLAGHKNSHIKPFTCTECNRPFASLYAVRAHMETHKRDNNLKYECWMCGALYSRAFALKDHLKQQHQQGEKAKAEVVGGDEEMAANSILVSEDDIILGLQGAANIEIIENEAE